MPSKQHGKILTPCVCVIVYMYACLCVYLSLSLSLSVSVCAWVHGCVCECRVCVNVVYVSLGAYHPLHNKDILKDIRTHFK